MLSAVYFLRNSAGLIKIGFTRDFENRRKTLERASKEKLELLALVPGGSTLEMKLHREFAADRKHGEWFAETPALLSRMSELTQIEPAKGLPDRMFLKAWAERRDAQTFLGMLAGKIIHDRSSAVPRLVAVDNLAAATGVSASFIRHLISNPAAVRADADFMLRLVDCYEAHCIEAVAASEKKARDLRDEAGAVRGWIDRFGLKSVASVVVEDGQ